jgi:hypothetical protein
MSLPMLQTARLLLRPLQEDDAEGLTQVQMPNLINLVPALVSNARWIGCSGIMMLLIGCGLSVPNMQPFAFTGDDAKVEGLKESSLTGFIKCELPFAVQQMLDLAALDENNTKLDPFRCRSPHDSSVGHSSGIPALRSPANKVASNKVVFGDSVPHSPPAFIFAMLDKEPSPRSLRASASSVAARSNSSLRA